MGGSERELYMSCCLNCFLLDKNVWGKLAKFSKIKIIKSDFKGCKASPKIIFSISFHEQKNKTLQSNDFLQTPAALFEKKKTTCIIRMTIGLQENNFQS